jgi:sugar fermentation stimulation protein A
MNNLELLLLRCIGKILQAIGALVILDSGLYIAIFYLPRTGKIRVGKLGKFHFKEGAYLYVGSAQRNLSARLKRHSTEKKHLRWHIDYLSAKARMLGAVTIPGQRKRECELARELGEMFQLTVPNFGASDCRCGGHLFFSPKLL